MRNVLFQVHNKGSLAVFIVIELLPELGCPPVRVERPVAITMCSVRTTYLDKCDCPAVMFDIVKRVDLAVGVARGKDRVLLGQSIFDHCAKLFKVIW